ncbi:hypothetical protein MCAMS1_02073 [biofilm metagenome]
MAISCRINADGSRYQFELLVFEQGTQSASVNNPTESLIKWPTALSELSGIQQTDNKLLKDGASALFSTGKCRPIIHYSWVQSAGPGGVILPMHINSDDGRLDGFIHLRNAQPLEIIVNLERQSLRANNAGKRYLYRINEKRTANFNQLQYFDNPNIGVLLQFSQL